MPKVTPAGGLDFANYERKAKKMSDASLKWSAADALAAINAMPENEYYRDEACVYRQELLRRRQKGCAK